MLKVSALRKVPNILGRKKVELRYRSGNTKQCGRNELIARVIQRHVGGPEKHRKQISSHIQVLCDFLKKDKNENGQLSTDREIDSRQKVSLGADLC